MLVQDDEPPPADPRLRIAEYSRGAANKRKTRMRPCPYTLKQYAFDASTSIALPPRRIVVTGFDPLAPFSQVQNLFSSFGEIATIKNQTDPNTGSFLGICLIEYKSSKSVRGGPAASATAAARKAHLECKGGQQRVGLRKVFAELDRDGSVGRRIVDRAVEKLHPKQVLREAPEETRLKMEPVDTPGPPPSAPKGPSGRSSMRPIPPPPPPPPPPVGPRSRPQLVEEKPILDQIRRMPYVFLPHSSVPVLDTTVHHLKNRMKSYHWKAIRCDRTGYYIIFEDSIKGEEEAVFCTEQCQGQMMFNVYEMRLECQRYGNPAYERSPSPERVQAEKKEKALQEKIRRERELDIEEEKKSRAQNLDPAVAAVDFVQRELREKLLEDVKSRIAAESLYNFLDPDRHAQKRRRLNISDPRGSNQYSLHIEQTDDTPPGGTPDSRNEVSGSGRQPLAQSTLNVNVLPRIRKGAANRRENIAFTDERRKQKTPKKTRIRSLHHRLYQHQEEQDSDDERRTTLTRNTEEQESRPVSRMSMASGDSDDETEIGTPRKLRNRTKGISLDQMDEDDTIGDETPGIPEPSLEVSSEKLLKSLENEAIKPSATRKRKRLLQELAARKKQKEDDELFGIERGEEQVSLPLPALETETSVTEIKLPGDESCAEPTSKEASETPDRDADMVEKKVTKKSRAKQPKKTKTQIFKEREALKKEQAKADFEELLAKAPAKVDIIEPEPIVQVEQPEEPQPGEILWGVSKDVPRRTVEDDPNIVLDLDGWQQVIKDDEDLKCLRQALTHRPAARLGNVSLWAWKQKEIKSLNRGGERGIVRAEALIEGYYVPNASGCARTEGIKKILESEKSKYLPHRIKVQRAREEREARAKEDPSTAAAEAIKQAAAKITSNSLSRTNRAENRRLVADIAAQRVLAASTGEGDVFRFNQLKKRKKPVKFARSAIHNWGLYAMENIAANDMIIEYVGEKVRQQVADMRERQYLKSGIGSSYLFRIDENTVIDATKRGGIARFINHCCTPNCTAKIIKVEGSKRIVIYALRDIEQSKSCSRIAKMHILLTYY